MEFEFKMGEYGLGASWKIIKPYNDVFRVDCDSCTLCKHAILGDLWNEGEFVGDAQEFSLSAGIIECYNEGGQSGTTLCIECLDEARETIVIE